MTENSKISCTDHTFNPWLGCTKIAPGCDNCYAAATDARFGGNHWSVKVNPRSMSEENWKKPARWNKAAKKAGIRKKVFCGSMCDWCDKDAPDGQRDRLFALIRETPWLDWQLLTKRAGLIKRCLPDDWGDGYPNVWIGVTAENYEFGKKRIKKLRKIKAVVRFVSAEPLIEDPTGLDLRGVDWVIIGGETGDNRRPMSEHWVSRLVYQCGIMGIPVWFKQWGGARPDPEPPLFRGVAIQRFPEVSS